MVYCVSRQSVVPQAEPAPPEQPAEGAAAAETRAQADADAAAAAAAAAAEAAAAEGARFREVQRQLAREAERRRRYVDLGFGVLRPHSAVGFHIPCFRGLQRRLAQEANRRRQVSCQ